MMGSIAEANIRDTKEPMVIKESFGKTTRLLTSSGMKVLAEVTFP
jgi:hypothetical protein